MTMRHRDRVLLALDHERPDRCPMQISFTPEFAARLRTDLGLPPPIARDPFGGSDDHTLERALGQDLLLTGACFATPQGGVDGPHVDEWGIGRDSIPYETRFGRGFYTEMVSHPLADADRLSGYRPPDPDRPELYESAAGTIRRHRDEYFIVGLAVTTIFETAWALRGLEALLIDMAEDPDLANTILDIPYRYHLATATRLAELGIDMIWLGDDVGAQHRMMISPPMWRTFLKPRMAEFCQTLKGVNPALKVAYHSDGFIEPIIPDLIEIGIDVLNPIQPGCMDPAALARRYGDRLCFWGTIDEQRTLPFQTPADVAAEVGLRLRTVGKNGGLILGPTHHVQLDTPLENFHAMVDAIKEQR